MKLPFEYYYGKCGWRNAFLYTPGNKSLTVPRKPSPLYQYFQIISVIYVAKFYRTTPRRCEYCFRSQEKYGLVPCQQCAPLEFRQATSILSFRYDRQGRVRI